MNPKYLWFLMLSYVSVILMANWFDARLVDIFSLITDAGTLIFPLTFLLSDLITEVYGYKHARRAIWTGFLFNLIFMAYGFLVTQLPSPPFATHNDIYQQLIGTNARIITASIISYFCSEPINALMLSRLKIKSRGKHMAARFVGSTLVASGLDSTIFSVIAFFGTMSNHALVIMILSMWLIKVVIEIIGLPFSVKIAGWLKQKEQLDVFDTNTRFGLFSLDANYQRDDNQFQIKNG